MKLGPIGNLTPQHQAPDGDAASIEAQRKVAQQFEAIFLRQMLSSLEKTGGLGGSSSGGAAVFRSMMVGALADGAAEGGGIGLADMVFKAMMPPVAAAQPSGVGSRDASSAAGAAAPPLPLPYLPGGS